MARILFVAGEASADRYAARLLSALTRRGPVDALGLGGAELEAAGMRLVADLRETSAMGTTELLPRLPRLGAAVARLAREIVRRPADLAVLVDAPDLNLPLARLCRARRVPVLAYVGPQVWAWRTGRLSGMAKSVTHAALVLPFEQPLYARAGVPATFVGHPLLDDPPVARAAARARLELPDRALVVALLPGSREAELAHHLPALAGAARLLCAAHPGARALLPVAPSLPFDRVVQSLRGSAIEPRAVRAATVLAAADVALVATGTATLEAARAGVPSVFFHRASPLTWALGRVLVRVQHLALPNLLLDRRAFPELWQSEVTEDRLAAEAEALLSDPARAAAQRLAAAAATALLGTPGAAERVADIAMRIVGDPRTNDPEGSTGRREVRKGPA